MTSKRMLQQQLDDYTRLMGEYDAAADFYNLHTDRAKSKAQQYLVPTYSDERYAEQARDDPSGRRSYMLTTGGDKDGNIGVKLTQDKRRALKHWLDESSRTVGEDGLTYYTAGNAIGSGRYALLPERPSADGIRAPTFTRAEQKRLHTPDMTPASAEMGAGRNTLQRANLAGWSPFASSNAGEGVLIRAMKGKL